MRARFLRLTARQAWQLQQLRQAAERDGAQRVARRLHAILLNDQEHSSGEIARVLDASRSKVSQWLSRYERYGWQALLEGQRSGRPKRLTSTQWSHMAGLFRRGPMAYGFASGVWTSPMLARVIKTEFGVRYHPGHVRKILRVLGARRAHSYPKLR